jgi:hypothetical protein
MLQGAALRRRGERSSPLQVWFDFATSLFGLRSARVSRVGDRVLAIADFSIKTVSARRRNQNARRMSYPEQERTLNYSATNCDCAPQAFGNTL